MTVRSPSYPTRSGNTPELPDGFYVNGITKNVPEKNTLEDENGKLIGEEVIYRPKSITRVFHPEHGILDLE